MTATSACCILSLPSAPIGVLRLSGPRFMAPKSPADALHPAPTTTFGLAQIPYRIMLCCQPDKRLPGWPGPSIQTAKAAPAWQGELLFLLTSFNVRLALTPVWLFSATVPHS